MRDDKPTVKFDSPLGLAPDLAKSERDVLVTGYLNMHDDMSAAISFADRLTQIWKSGVVKNLFKNIGYCADAALEMLRLNPKADLSAHNLRVMANRKAGKPASGKFSKTIRPTL